MLKIETDTLAFRVTALTLAAALLPLTGLLIFAATRSSGALTDAAALEIQQRADLIARNIERFIEQKTVDIRILSQSPILEGDDSDAMTQMIQEFLIENLSVEDIQLVSPEGTILTAAAGKEMIGRQIEDVFPAETILPLFQAARGARQGQVFLSELEPMKFDLGLHMLTPVTSDQNRSVSKILVFQVNTAQIQKTVSDFDGPAADVDVGAAAGSRKFTYVVDRENRVLVTEDPSVNPMEKFPDVRGNTSLVERLAEGGESSAMAYVDSYDDRVMAGIATTGGWPPGEMLRWSIVTVVPSQEVTQPARETRNIIVLFAAIVAVLTMLIATRLAQGISEPLRRLVESMNRFGRGQAGDLPPAEGEIREVRELSSAFREMIADRRSVEEQLAQAHRMDAVSQLMGGVAHDFNNLLAVIVGNLELLREDIHGHEEAEILVEQAAVAADRGAMLTHRLLAFSRKQPLQPKTTNLNSLVEGMMDLLGRTLGESVEIVPQLAQGLWKAVADPGQLETALVNLAINARDAMRSSDGRLTVETANLRLREQDIDQDDVRPGEYVMIALHDNGEGMTPEVIERAFEPFFTTKQSSRGRGLGLSMVFGFIKQSGGHIRIESEIGRGTTVRMFLPRAPEMMATGEMPAAQRVSPQGVGEKILVVEDEDHVRDLLVRLLLRLGYKPVEAKNGPMALALLREHPDIDLMLTDLGLPGGISGTNLAREARRQWPNLKVIYVSGYSEHAARSRGRIDEDIELIHKPFKREDLARSIRATLEG